jgi:hypothetical protein
MPTYTGSISLFKSFQPSSWWVVVPGMPTFTGSISLFKSVLPVSWWVVVPGMPKSFQFEINSNSKFCPENDTDAILSMSDSESNFFQLNFRQKL